MKRDEKWSLGIRCWNRMLGKICFFASFLCMLTASAAFVCSKDGIYSHPRVCTKFIFCANKIPYVMNCPKGLHFNRKIRTCDYKKNADCDVEEKPAAGVLATTASVGSSGGTLERVRSSTRQLYRSSRLHSRAITRKPHLLKKTSSGAASTARPDAAKTATSSERPEASPYSTTAAGKSETGTNVLRTGKSPPTTTDSSWRTAPSILSSPGTSGDMVTAGATAAMENVSPVQRPSSRRAFLTGTPTGTSLEVDRGTCLGNFQDEPTFLQSLW